MVFLEGVDVHIRDWGQLLLRDFSSGGFPPVSFDSLHVPLVDDGHDVLLVDVVNVPENSLAIPVNHDILLLWGNLIEHNNQKVDSASVT